MKKKKQKKYSLDPKGEFTATIPPLDKGGVIKGNGMSLQGDKDGFNFYQIDTIKSALKQYKI